MAITPVTTSAERDAILRLSDEGLRKYAMVSRLRHSFFQTSYLTQPPSQSVNIDHTLPREEIVDQIMIGMGGDQHAPPASPQVEREAIPTLPRSYGTTHRVPYSRQRNNPHADGMSTPNFGYCYPHQTLDVMFCRPAGGRSLQCSTRGLRPIATSFHPTRPTSAFQQREQ